LHELVREGIMETGGFVLRSIADSLILPRIATLLIYVLFHYELKESVALCSNYLPRITRLPASVVYKFGRLAWRLYNVTTLERLFERRRLLWIGCSYRLLCEIILFCVHLGREGRNLTADVTS
jgi:hypothetical protein